MGRLKTTQKDRISCVPANPLLLAHVGAEALKKLRAEAQRRGSGIGDVIDDLAEKLPEAK